MMPAMKPAETPPSTDAPTLHSLADGLLRGDFAPVPDDWCIAVADVQGSTHAIEQGRYKQVNALGAACIVAACNACGRDDLAFVFGGDGAAVAMPALWWPKLRQSWQVLGHRAQREFGLTLRIGAIPVADLRALGAQVQLAWQALPGGFRLACFSGDGMQRAEGLVKERADEPPDASAADVSVDGLECRWNDVPSQNGNIVCVLARPVAGDVSGLVELMQTIEAWGPAVRPVNAQKLPVAAVPQHLRTELALKTPGTWQRALQHALVGLKLWLLAPLVRRDKLNPATVAGRYAHSVGLNCDQMKFDGTLRAVLDLTPAQDQTLQALLDRLHREGRVDFGLHRSHHALMTCFVRSLERHVHFVDGGDGGYARAAQQLKSQSDQSGRGPSDAFAPS